MEGVASGHRRQCAGERRTERSRPEELFEFFFVDLYCTRTDHHTYTPTLQPTSPLYSYYASETEALCDLREKAGFFCANLKPTELEMNRSFCSDNNKDEEGTLVRGERWVRLSRTPLHSRAIGVYCNSSNRLAAVRHCGEGKLGDMN